MRLENRVALVTGAATGLGRAYAVRLAAEGAHVCAADVNFAGVQGTARLVAGEGRKALAVEMDVTSEQQTLDGAKKAFDHFGSIDILVNNAGIVRNTPRVPIEETDVADWHRIIAVNLTGNVSCRPGGGALHETVEQGEDHQHQFRCGAARPDAQPSVRVVQDGGHRADPCAGRGSRSLQHQCERHYAGWGRHLTGPRGAGDAVGAHAAPALHRAASLAQPISTASWPFWPRTTAT